MAAGITVMEMGQAIQSSLEPVQSMRCHDVLSREAAIGLHSRARHRLKLSRRKSSDYLLEDPISQSVRAKRSRDQLKQTPAKPSPFFHNDVAFVFTIFTNEEHRGFEFPAHHSTSFRGIKRRRPRSDIDGPNTLEVSRKKRRLRSHLITSRLSQPFSQPATHILNRQGKENGDRRFRKMATTIDLSRRAVRLQATSYLRYSVMNSLRRRLGLVKHTGSEQDNDQNPVNHDMDTSAKAPWQQQAAKPDTGGKKDLASLAKIDTQPTTPPTVAPIEPAAKPPACRLSNPVALPLPSADQPVTIDRISSRIDSTPLSPEPRPPLSWMYDDHEEDSFAFLHLEDEHSADEDSEHVYCDFDAIFGGKSSTPSEPQSPDDHTYEEYMDELDGISWRIR
ncbi:hypothetical protein PT974_04867 [Cladobotryum mycophilum]|uniref:Mating type protein n=1 Tax=Cladobotryum mycophilum TaxID=491253 RepID=A0ABR0SQE6_9HYPO